MRVDSAIWTARVALRSLRAMRDGLRFAHYLPSDSLGPPAIAPTDITNPLEQYFDSIKEGPGIWKWRHYFPIYHRHLAKFVGREVHVAEIGIYSGGSLPMWRSYFGEGCQVYGIDIEPACRVHEQEGIRVFIGDQADASFWRRFLDDAPRIDVVIDDGGHQAHQQITSLRELLPGLAMGGVYICEDVHGGLTEFDCFVDGITHSLNTTGAMPSPATPLHQHVQSVHRYPGLTAIEKPDHRIEAFEAPKHGSLWQPGIY